MLRFDGTKEVRKVGSELQRGDSRVARRISEAEVAMEERLAAYIKRFTEASEAKGHINNQGAVT